MAEDWIIGKYIHLAVCRSSFVEREALLAEYEAMVAKSAKASKAIGLVSASSSK